MKVVLGLMASLTLAGMATSASAADMECVWARLPEAQRQAFVTASAGSVVDPSAVFGEAAIASAVASCGYGDKDPKAVKSAFIGVARQHAVEGQIGETMGLNPERLDMAWKSVDRRKVEGFGAALAANSAARTADRLEEMGRIFREQLPEQLDSRLLSDYVVARAIRDYFERQADKPGGA